VPVEAGTTRVAEHLALIDELSDRLQRNALGGTESSRKRHVARGRSRGWHHHRAWSGQWSRLRDHCQ